MLRTLALTTAVALIACGSGVSGDYGGEDCIYEKLSFEGDGEVRIAQRGEERAGEYSIDGDLVIVTGPDGQSMVFTQNGSRLEADGVVCSSL
jgi:hypothetical protein